PGGRAAKTDPRRRRSAVHAMGVLRQQDPAQERDIFETAADDPHRVEGVALHLDADPADLTKAWFLADNTAECGRANGRAAGLSAEGQWPLEIGYGRGRAARRAAGRMGGVVRMGRWARMAVGKFGRYGLAEDHAPRGADQRDASGVGKRPVAAI